MIWHTLVLWGIYNAAGIFKVTFQRHQNSVIQKVVYIIIILDIGLGIFEKLSVLLPKKKLLLNIDVGTENTI